MKTLVIVNDQPTAASAPYNALRLANAREATDLRVYLLGDAVTCSAGSSATSSARSSPFS